MPAHEAVVSFEAEDVPAYVRATGRSALEVSGDRYIDGRRSLKWSWRGGRSVLTIKRDIPFLEDAPRLRRMPAGSTFAVWVYNATPRDATLRFSFGSGKSEDCGFDFGLNYTGWRTCWVMFDRDMRGTPHEGMDTLRIRTPAGVAEGELYIDNIVLAENVDARHQYPDVQTPFVKGRDAVTGSHWLPRMDLMRQWSEVTPEPSTPRERLGIESIEQRCVDSYLAGSVPGDEEIDALLARYETYGIEQTPAGLRGRRIVSKVGLYIYPDPLRQPVEDRSVNLKAYQQHLLEIAQAYRLVNEKSPQKPRLREAYLMMARHLQDQGWAEGSCQGTVHHLGYSLRALGPATLLMRDVLAEEGMLEAQCRAVLWFLNTPLILDPESFQSDMDYYNTQAPGQLVSLLTMPDDDTKAWAVKRLSTGISRVMAQETTGTRNGFKVDGTAFHHSGHYPAYAAPAFANASELMYWLSDTPFELTSEARANFRRALLASRVYSNPDWSIALSGRHPLSDNTARAQVLAQPFRYAALAGDPVTGEPVDHAVLAAGLRLDPRLADGHPALQGLDVAAEPTPQGHWSFNYAAAGIHRHNKKMVTLKGYNQNVWSSEIYTNDNRFGRYQSHGSITILDEGRGVDSGFVQDGWDWNRLPGTTTVHLPLDQLEAPSNGTVMERSPRRFAGSSHLAGKYGAFAIDLEDDKFRGSKGLLARKSAFCFEDRIVCLGTGITSPNPQFSTETTLFQNALRSGDDGFWSNDTVPITKDTRKADAAPERQAVALVDAYRNGYYVPASQSVRIQRGVQDSMHNKTKHPTQGLFGTAWIDHGPAPADAIYEYAIVLDTDIDAMRRFKVSMQAGGDPAYRVLQQDQKVHAVLDTATQTAGIACFEPSSKIDHPIVRSINRAALVLLQEQPDGALRLSVCSPDLNLVDNVSTPVKVSVRLQGRWLAVGDSVRATRAGEATTLAFTCVDGLPVETTLQRELPAERVAD